MARATFLFLPPQQFDVCLEVALIASSLFLNDSVALMNLVLPESECIRSRIYRKIPAVTSQATFSRARCYRLREESENAAAAVCRNGGFGETRSCFLEAPSGGIARVGQFSGVAGVSWARRACKVVVSFAQKRLSGYNRRRPVRSWSISDTALRPIVLKRC